MQTHFVGDAKNGDSDSKAIKYKDKLGNWETLALRRLSKTNTGVYDYVRNISMSGNHGRRYLVSNIEDASQLTGSSNISETMTYTINTPTTNLRHSTMANSQEVYLGDSNNDRQSEIIRPKLEILVSLKQ